MVSPAGGTAVLHPTTLVFMPGFRFSWNGSKSKSKITKHWRRGDDLWELINVDNENVNLQSFLTYNPFAIEDVSAYANC